MPVMDGLEFLQRLRAEFGPGTPPVVFCTTEIGQGNRCSTVVSC
jgi:CheY-like chemotaxis protein